RYHYLLALALQADEHGDLRRAAAHFGRALDLDPSLARCRADPGLLALRLGRTEEGPGLLRPAPGRAPDSPEVLARLVKGLTLAGRADEARAALRAALFRNPRAPRIRQLGADFEMQQLRRRRDAERLRRRGEEDGPVLL